METGTGVREPGGHHAAAEPSSARRAGSPGGSHDSVERRLDRVELRPSILSVCKPLPAVVHVALLDPVAAVLLVRQPGPDLTREAEEVT